MAGKKKASDDLSVLDAVAPSLDQRLSAGLALANQLTKKWSLTPASVTNPGLMPNAHRRRVFSSGLTSLDRKLKIGGFPRGHITELFGPPHGGKSLALYNFISEVQHQCTVCESRIEYTDQTNKGKPITVMVDYMVRGTMTKIPVTIRESMCSHCGAKDSGGLVLLFDQENSFDPVWVERQGVELTKMIVAKLPTGEMTTEMLRTMLLKIKPEAICIDSVAQLQPATEQDRDEVTDSTMPGLHAKIMSKLCRHITSIFTMAPTEAPAIVWVNQVRADMSGNNQPKTTGGYAPEHYSSIRLYFYPGQLQNREKPELGRDGKITIYKARVAEGLYRQTLNYTLLPSGFDKARDTFEAANESGVFHTGKATSGRFYYADSDVSNSSNELAYGKDKMIARLRNEPELYREISSRVMANTQLVSAPLIFTGDDVPGHEHENSLVATEA